MKLNGNLCYLYYLIFVLLALNIVSIHAIKTETENKTSKENTVNSLNKVNTNENSSKSPTETTSISKVNVAKNNEDTIVSYEAHAHNIHLDQSSPKMFSLYSKGLIEGEAKGELLNGGPIYWQGWGKYFHYEDVTEITKPKDFFVNNEYFAQKVLRKDYDKKDKIGYLNIPSKFHFFISVTENNLIILSSRARKLFKIQDTLHIDLIKPIPLDSTDKGGVESLGEFDEGNCLQVFTLVPSSGPNADFKNTKDDGNPENWVLCFDSVNERSELMQILRKIKMLKEKANGDHFLRDSRNPSISKLLQPKMTPKIERYSGPDANKYLDGFWVLLQDWSDCTLKCGGGVQFQQWLCQPPVKGGKKCLGNSIRKRPCNLNPCPNVLSMSTTQTKNTVEVVKKPIIQSMPWSSRFQRYIECEVKETDILYIKTDVPNMIGKEVKYPGRMIMTNRTLAAYEDDSLSKVLFVFNLQDTLLNKDKDDYCCLWANSQDKRFKICGFENDCGSKDEPRFVRQWNGHFNLFKQKCYVDLPKEDWKARMRKEEDEDGGHIDADQDGILARENLIKHKLKEKQELDLEKKIVSTEEVALKAIRKEMKLERLIREEEKLKEKEKIKNLLNLKVKEEKKQECLEKALKEREDQNLKSRDNVVAEREIAKIKVNAKKEVEIERSNLRKKILEFKNKSNRKQKAIEQQINLIRSKMAENLLLANKNGDMFICKNSSKDQELINKYCDANFVTNYKKNQRCKDPEEFCPTCCENEFGNMFLNKRDECYNMCDQEINQDIKGDWIWTKEGMKSQ
jgi:hypothetical protein